MKFSGGASPLWQEAAVVMLIVVRVVAALRGVSHNEAKGLIILTACALFVEIASKGGMRLRSLKVRATQAPGIVLGALTLPLVMASRLSQLLKVPHHAQLGLERARVEFWSSIACSTALLLLLVSSMTLQRKEKDRSRQNGYRGKQNENERKRKIHNVKEELMNLDCSRQRFGGCQSVGATASISLLAVMLVTQLGFMTGTWGTIWCVAHALGSAFLFHYLLQAFPYCTSAGEGMLVAQGLSLYVGNAVFFTLSKLVVSRFWPESLGGNEDPVDAIVQAIVLGLLLVPLLYKYLLTTLSLRALELTEKKGAVSEVVSRAGLFYCTIMFVVLWGSPAWLRSVTKISLHPVLWVLKYVLEEPRQRLGLCAYWILAITLFSVFLHHVAVKKQVARIMVRKGFHVMAVVMFVPALTFQPGFLRIAFALALGVFVIVETVRVWRIPPLGEQIHTFLKAFTDSRDSDVLIISHFSLLLGCAIPVWLSSTSSIRPLAAYAGILSLGIGDTMASVIGYNFGSVRLSSWSKKTWEGTIAGILSTIAASLLLSCFSTTVPLAGQLGSIAMAATGAGLVEAFTLQLDNAFVPLISYALLSL